MFKVGDVITFIWSEDDWLRWYKVKYKTRGPHKITSINTDPYGCTWYRVNDEHSGYKSKYMKYYSCTTVRALSISIAADIGV